MLAYVGTQSDKMPAAISSMDDLIRNLPQNQNSFAQAKTSLENGIRTSRTTKTNIYFVWRNMQLMNLPKTSNEIVFEQLNKITLNDVVQFHDKYVKQGIYTLTVLADKNKVTEADLKKYGKVISVSLDELFGY